MVNSLAALVAKLNSKDIMRCFAKKTRQQLLDSAAKAALKKSLTAFDLASIGIGCVIGIGIFVSIGQGAHAAGPGVIISLLIGAITSGLCALCYAELACMFPVAGSSYSYAYVAFGEVVAWVVGWDLILEYLVNGSAVASGWSATVTQQLGDFGLHLPKLLVTPPQNHGLIDLPAVLITLTLTGLLYIGIKQSARANNWMVIVKLTVIGLFIFLGFSHIHLQNFIPFAPFGWSGIMAGAAITFFSYTGFDAISTAAEETKNPQRDLPLALLLCLGAVIFFYVATAAVLIGLEHFKDIDSDNALPASLMKIGIHWGSALVAVGAIVGMISSLLAVMYGQIRIFMVMSRDGLLPERFAKIHPLYKTPHICTLITGAVTALVCGLLPLPVIIDLCNIGTLFAFIIVSVALLILRKTMPEVERKFKCPGVPFVPALAILACIYLMIHLQLITWISFLVWLVLGVIIYFAYCVRRRRAGTF